MAPIGSATTASAAFGCSCGSSRARSPLLPFLSLVAKQILFNNFLSDLPMMTVSTDRVDPHVTVSLLTELAVILVLRTQLSALLAHLEQIALLNPEQVRRYNQLRGYAGTANESHEKKPH
jgi:hypothetical protein